MFPGRYTLAPSSTARKSKADSNKLSMLPKPQRVASMDRGSDVRRASHRSSSAEPRGGPRLSRDASASKIPLNRKSKSQQNVNERYGQYGSAITPVRNSAYSRATTTPVRTPTQDGTHGWEACVERALAFVTRKDQRPVSDAAWQRGEHARVQAALAARAEGSAGGALALIRPLTITRFVEICGGLVHAVCGSKLTNDNYVAKLPNLAKRFLYPGAVSKSWLKTVNTLHAFPQALAIIAYFLDLVEHIERPLTEDGLHRDKDALSTLRREYVQQCWAYFDDNHCDFGPLQDDHIVRLRRLLGDDEQRLNDLHQTNQELEAALNDESEQAARAEEERARGRRDALAAAVRALRIEGRQLHANAEDEHARAKGRAAQIDALDADIARATEEIERVSSELESQTMCVSERAQLVADAQYAARVHDSKLSLAHQLAKMAQSKEQELIEWQERALDSCVQYKRSLIHLAARHPHLAAIAVDENELMEESCASALSRGVDTLRALLTETMEQRAEHDRARIHHHRQFATLLQEARASVGELESTVSREMALAESEAARDAAAGAEWARQRDALYDRLRALEGAADTDLTRVERDLNHWEGQDALWRRKLCEMREYTQSQRAELARRLHEHKVTTAAEAKAIVASWHAALDDIVALNQHQ